MLKGYVFPPLQRKLEMSIIQVQAVSSYMGIHYKDVFVSLNYNNNDDDEGT
jgi:hypothetical protein